MVKRKSTKRAADRETGRDSARLIRSAAKSGAAIADEALEIHQERQRLRARRHGALRRAPQRATEIRPAAASIPKKTRQLLGIEAVAGKLIAEGDSWFDYPRADVLQILEDEYLFDVESVAHKGDCVEDMAHSVGQFDAFTRRLEKMLRDGHVPRAILLSGGGNDIAGDEFGQLLNHARSPLPVLNDDIVKGVVDVRLRAAYASMIGGLTAIAERFLNRPIPIVIHGYDYAIPDGRGFLGGFWILPGPWVGTRLQAKRPRGFSRQQAGRRRAHRSLQQDAGDSWPAIPARPLS